MSTLHQHGGTYYDNGGKWKEQRLKECLWELTCNNKHDCYNCNCFEVWEKITPWNGCRTYLKNGRD